MDNRLKEIRVTKKLTQQKVSSDLGISHNSLSNYETGERSPTPEMLLRFSDYYGVSVDYLLGREETISIPPELEGARIAFEGGLEGLTQDDIDDVAKYIAFLKDKRK